MTAGQKTGAGIGVTVLAVLTLVLSSQSLPVIQWLFGEAKTLFGLPLFAPTTIAMLVGAGAPAWLPHVLPAQWPAHRTMRVTRLLGFGIAFVMVFSRYPSALGAQYGLFAGTGAYALWTMGSSFVYRMRPHMQPPSLKDDGANSGD